MQQPYSNDLMHAAMPSDSDDEDSPKNSGNGGRMQELLASYYGMQRGGDRTSDMESTTFDSKAYIRGLLRNEKMEKLLQKDDEMVSKVKESSELSCQDYSHASLGTYNSVVECNAAVSKYDKSWTAGSLALQI